MSICYQNCIILAYYILKTLKDRKTRQFSIRKNEFQVFESGLIRWIGMNRGFFNVVENQIWSPISQPTCDPFKCNFQKENTEFFICLTSLLLHCVMIIPARIVENGRRKLSERLMGQNSATIIKNKAKCCTRVNLSSL